MFALLTLDGTQKLYVFSSEAKAERWAVHCGYLREEYVIQPLKLDPADA